MRKLFMILGLVLLCAEISCFLKLPRNIKFQYKDVVDAKLLQGSRTRRSVGGTSHPQWYDLDLDVDGSNINLHLTRNDDLSTDVPTLTLNQGVLTEMYLKDQEESVFYQDVANAASFVVQYNRSKSQHVFGTFHFNGNDYILQKDLRNTESLFSGENRFEIIKENKENVNLDDFLQPTGAFNADGTRLRHLTFVIVTLIIDKFVKYCNQMEEFKFYINYIEKEKVHKLLTSHHRQKRATGSNQVELLIVCDYAVYKFWYDQSDKPTTTEKEAEAESSVKQYYAFVLNGMDAMYKNIQTTSYSISILFAGIVISKTAGDSTWTENIKNTSAVPNTVNSNQGLNDFSSWTNANSGSLPNHDHAMLFTRYELEWNGSTGNAGLAFLGTICGSQRQSIVEDKFNFIIITVAAHELGHGLSASHDGDGNNCFADDAYIMAPSSGVHTGQKATHPWIFSNCSTDYFTAKINLLESSNENCMKILGSGFDPTALTPYDQNLPGSVYNADTQCMKMYGNESYFCRYPYANDYSTICNILYCRVPDEGVCRGIVAGDGTLCDNKKICISGICKEHSSASQGNANCLYGDNRGKIFSNNWTCADMVQLAPSNCDSVPEKCCASCADYLNPTTTDASVIRTTYYETTQTDMTTFKTDTTLTHETSTHKSNELSTTQAQMKTQITESPTTLKITEELRSTQMNEALITTHITHTTATAKINEKQTSTQSTETPTSRQKTEGSTITKTTEASTIIQMTESTISQNMTKVPTSTQITEATMSPQMTEGSTVTRTAEASTITRITELTTSQNMTEVPNSTQITEATTPPQMTEEPTVTKTAEATTSKQMTEAMTTSILIEKQTTQMIAKPTTTHIDETTIITDTITTGKGNESSKTAQVRETTTTQMTEESATSQISGIKTTTKVSEISTTTQSSQTTTIEVAKKTPSVSRFTEIDTTTHKIDTRSPTSITNLSTTPQITETWKTSPITEMQTKAQPKASTLHVETTKLESETVKTSTVTTQQTDRVTIRDITTKHEDEERTTQTSVKLTELISITPTKQDKTPTIQHFTNPSIDVAYTESETSPKVSTKFERTTMAFTSEAIANAGTTSTLIKTTVMAQTTRHFQGAMTLTKEWSPAYSNESSTEYQSLKKIFTEQLTEMYSNSSLKEEFVDITITGFREGSVVADFILELSSGSSQTEQNIVTITQQAIQSIISDPSSKLDLIAQVNAQLLNITEVIVDTTTAGAATDPTKQNSGDIEISLIAGIVSATVLLLIIIILALVIVIRKRSKGKNITSENDSTNSQTMYHRYRGYDNHGLVPDYSAIYNSHREHYIDSGMPLYQGHKNFQDSLPSSTQFY